MRFQKRKTLFLGNKTFELISNFFKHTDDRKWGRFLLLENKLSLLLEKKYILYIIRKETMILLNECLTIQNIFTGIVVLIFTFKKHD